MNGQKNDDELLNININDEDSDSTSGKLGKLSERVKKIARDKKKYRNNLIDEDGERNFGDLRRFLLIPIMFIGGLLGKQSSFDKIKKQNNQTNISNDVNNRICQKNNMVVKKNEKKWATKFNRSSLGNKFNVNSQININNQEKKIIINPNEKLKRIFRDKTIYSQILSKINGKKSESIEDNKEVELLEKEILKLIKKRLVKLINEYEILGSDFYVLRELLIDDIYYDKCLQNVKEIKKLLTKINALKDKYDYLKDNIDFDNLLELDDEVLQEKIIELRNKIDSNNLNYLVKDYKLLKEYQSLYLKIDKLQNQAYEYEDERKKRVEVLKEKKIDFEKFKHSVYNYKSVGEEYSYFVKKQNQILTELGEKIGVIDSYEKVEYIYKGYRKILANSFKYIGLLLLSPLKGVVPGIATQTIATKNVLDNLKKSFAIEEKRMLVYEAIDYEAEINRVVNDIDYMTMLIDGSLSDVVELKRKYKEKFKKDEGNYREYQEAIKQLNKIENSIIGSKVKVEIMKEKMEVNRKINENKMVKVRKLNLQENSKH